MRMGPIVESFHNAVALLPTQDDLPDGYGIPIETSLHKKHPAEIEAQRTERLAQILREQGIDPDKI